MEDKTWLINIQVQVTTMCGWEPEHEDVQRMLDEGSLELVGIIKVQDTK